MKSKVEFFEQMKLESENDLRLIQDRLNVWRGIQNDPSISAAHKRMAKKLMFEWTSYAMNTRKKYFGIIRDVKEAKDESERLLLPPPVLVSTKKRKFEQLNVPLILISLYVGG